MITGWSGLSADYVNRVNTDRPVRLEAARPRSRHSRVDDPWRSGHLRRTRVHPWGGVAREQGYRAIVCVPLIAGDEVLGTLNGYYMPVHTFTL